MGQVSHNHVPCVVVDSRALMITQLATQVRRILFCIARFCCCKFAAPFKSEKDRRPNRFKSERSRLTRRFGANHNNVPAARCKISREVYTYKPWKTFAVSASL